MIGFCCWTQAKIGGARAAVVSDTVTQANGGTKACTPISSPWGGGTGGRCSIACTEYAVLVSQSPLARAASAEELGQWSLILEPGAI